jgi:2-polyprenyl-6-methoxyphenol hydroxylase-like FAD-dependent oxidoreductase
MNIKRDRAIVVGGSMAGLLAARVLAKHFNEVILLDRDTFPEGPEHRRGVPQGRHTHGLLASGRRVLESFFPGIGQELMDAGAVPADIIGDSKWFLEGGLSAKFPSGLDGLLLSRPLLEYTVRRRILQLPNVTVRSGIVVTGLHATADRAAVTGVRCDHELISASLVVDASGRASSAADWLDLLGYERPIEDRIEIGVGYTTRLFQRRRGDSGGDAAVVIPATPETMKGGVMLAQEGDRWTVTLFSYFRDYAPTDLEGFRQYARRLPFPGIYDVIRDAEPIGEAQVARFPASLRRRYESLPRFPEGFLVFGDAICSFNPTFGQGMSTAALEAVELDTELTSGRLFGIASRFFERAAKVVDIPWSVSVGADLGLPCTKGPRPLAVRLINWYVSKLHKASHHDAAAALAFHRVANLLAPPPSILDPRIVARVIKANLLSARPGSTRPVAQEV